MNKKTLRADILLLLTAAIWGFGFVAQRAGFEYIGPFAFNGVRFILGSLSLLPLIFFRRRAASRSSVLEVPFKYLLVSSLAAGGCIFVAVITQQFGIMFTTAGNAGFITGLYVVLTPIFGIFLKRKTGYGTWIGSVLTLTGLYFLAGKSGSINPGDVITVFSAILWTVHVLLIDHLMQGKKEQSSEFHLDPVELSAGQFAVCGILSMLGAFLAEPHIGAVMNSINPALLSTGLFKWEPFPALIALVKSGAMQITLESLIPILYGGFASVGIAYTLQVVAQRDAPPAHAAVILSFEGCFAALGGVLLLGETIGAWTLIGFILMLSGMLASQWDVIKKSPILPSKPMSQE